MSIIEAQFHASWVYSDALRFMEQAFLAVKTHPHKIIIGMGSHSHPIITLGRNPTKNHVVPQKGIDLFSIERGGGPTAHEPGQMVFYPILDLAFHRLTPKDLACIMQHVALRFIESVGCMPERSNESLGVFIDGFKVVFIGLRIKDGISSHGLSINIFNDAHIFSLFDPCGIKSLKVSSLKNFKPTLTKTLPEVGDMLVEFFQEELLVRRNKYC